MSGGAMPSGGDGASVVIAVKKTAAHSFETSSIGAARKNRAVRIWGGLRRGLKKTKKLIKTPRMTARKENIKSLHHMKPPPMFSGRFVLSSSSRSTGLRRRPLPANSFRGASRERRGLRGRSQAARFMPGGTCI